MTAPLAEGRKVMRSAGAGTAVLTLAIAAAVASLRAKPGILLRSKVYLPG